MKLKEVIIVVLMMLIFAMAMLMYIVINDSIKASSVPIISNNIENITCGNKNNDGDNANNKVNKIENLLINKEDSNSAEKNQKENIEMTVYVDDVIFSSDKEISQNFIDLKFSIFILQIPIAFSFFLSND